jgi:hypothetical protein
MQGICKLNDTINNALTMYVIRSFDLPLLDLNYNRLDDIEDDSELRGSQPGQ